MSNHNSNPAEEPFIQDIAGPGLKVQQAPVETKRLSKKGKFIIFGGVVFVVTAMLIGVMSSGKSKNANPGSDQGNALNGAAVNDAPGTNSPYTIDLVKQKKESEVTGAPEPTDPNAKPAADTNPETANLSVRGGNGSVNPPGSTNTANGTNAPPTPSEAHRLWLEKRKYERLQGMIMAGDSAITSDIAKGGSALAASKGSQNGNSPLASEQGDPAIAGLNQRMAAANSRASNARAMASAEAMRMAGQQPGAESMNPYMPTSASTAGVDPAVAAQVRNKAFLKEAAENGYLAEVLKPKMGEYEITAGSVIPAVMLSGINSDLPGTIVAQTRQTVYATNDPNTVLIPQGARLIGRYSSDVAYGQERILAAWDEMILPNGSRISMRGMAAADGQGQSGIEDQVNNHFFKTWGSALLVSMLGVAAQQSQPQNQGTLNTPSASAQAAAAAMNSLSEVGSKILQKNLNVSPTLQVRPGMTFNVMVNRSIILPSY